MKQTVDESLFIQAFENYNRVNEFGYAGLRALFEHFEDFADDGGEEVELDVIAICCEYAQYDTVQAALDDYSLDSLEELQDNTIVILYNIYGQEEQACIVQTF